MKKKPYVIHPYLWSIYPILYIYTNNKSFIPFESVIRSLLFSLFLFSLLFIVIKSAYQDSIKAGILVTLSIVLFYSYGGLTQSPASLKLYTTLLIILYFLLYIVFSLFIATIEQKKLYSPTKYLNIMAITLFILLIPSFTFKKNFAKTDIQEIKNVFNIPINTNNTKIKRDIYYIILDGYARSDVLNKTFNYNNEEFIKELESLGFYTAKNSFANYSQTLLSLNSSFNMQYLDNLASYVGNEEVNRKPLNDLLLNNTVMDTLNVLNYDIYVVSGGWGYLPKISEPYNIERTEKLNKLKAREYFESILLRTTFLTAFSKPDYNVMRNAVKNGFEITENFSLENEKDKPVFVYTHILSPHPPFLFNSDGSSRECEEPCLGLDGDHYKGTRQGYYNGYREQINYIEKITLNTIKNILENSQYAPIIVIQADHGPGYNTYWENIEKTNLKERMAILNAYYLPDLSTEFLNENVTPVNTFRIIFNEYFDAKLELLDDRVYFSTWSKPYDFIDVTEKL